MSDYKQKTLFDSDLYPKEDIELNSKQAFTQAEMFIPAENTDDDTEIESTLDTVVRPRTGRLWKMSTVLLVFGALVTWQTADSVWTAIKTGDWLSVGWSGFIAGLAAVGVGAICKELWHLRKLKRHFSVQEHAEELIQNNRVGQGEAFCGQLAEYGGITAGNLGYQRWKNSINTSHSDAEIIDLYDALVIAQQDKQALDIVTRYATEAAALVAVSPLAMADMLLVGWRSFKMIEKLADLYGIELGYWSRLKLFKAVLVNMATAGASEMVVDASVDLLSMDLAGKVSTRAGQGIGVGILTARLGIKAMALLRPLPWVEQRRVKLSQVRKHILAKVAAVAVK
ncbi:YcjF family protein [Vibrio palustris]|uniref:TIGR01620 family protein n=1 Tax=Vibrio palustris TaxID=1918946 RepID=A0A1R4B2N1_9VIBR|nr:TIGR01620 family protein [Vibrio palustris]SJL83161.1 hypothetical protein VPAL9027_01110 [Vibrio palustris]